MTDYLRLAFGTAVVLAPGWAVARAFGMRSASATLAWSLASIAAALAATFALHGSLTLTLVLLLGIGAVAVAYVRPLPSWPPLLGAGGAGLLGLAFGIAIWWTSGPVGGDGLFHLGRVRKLVAFDDLSLRAVGEFADGGLHPGYAFPLWHGFLALVARVSGLDPTVVVQHEGSLLAPLAFVVAFEAGAAVFGAAWAGWAVLAGLVALYGLAPGHGGAYVLLTNPGTAARQLLFPAAIALFFTALREETEEPRPPYDGAAWSPLVTLVALGLSAALVHPAFAAFMLLPLAGYLPARMLLARGREVGATLAGLAAFALPLGAVLLWLRPVVASTASVTPSEAERARSVRLYADQLVVHGSSYRLAPEVLSRAGAVAVAALVCVPLAALAGRRRWAALVLGGSLLVLALTLVPALFTHLADAVSLSQARRVAGFLPFAFAFAGGAWALARLGWAALPTAFALGALAQHRWPGDFGGRLLDGGGPAAATWIAVAGGAVALAAAAARPLAPRLERPQVAALAAWLFVLPIAVDGFRDWSPVARKNDEGLPPGLLHALRTTVPERAVVFSDLETSYRISALAPVYVASAPPAHVADTVDNYPYTRRRLTLRFFRTGNLAIPRGLGATWIVVDRSRSKLVLRLPKAYGGGRYALFRLSART